MLQRVLTPSILSRLMKLSVVHAILKKKRQKEELKCRNSESTPASTLTKLHFPFFLLKKKAFGLVKCFTKTHFRYHAQFEIHQSKMLRFLLIPLNKTCIYSQIMKRKYAFECNIGNRVRFSQS